MVENLRLDFSSDSEETPFFVLVAIHKQLYGPDSEREFAKAFTVPGRSEIERTFEFQRDSAPVQLTDGSDHTFTLWAKVYGERRTRGPWLSRWLPSWHETSWRALLELELRKVVWTGGIIPRDNRNDDEPDRAS